MPEAPKWDTDEQGHITIFPVTGFETAAAFQSSALLRIQFVRSDGQLKTGEHDAIQFVLSPQIARQMADDLLQLAQHLSRQPPPGTITS
jgi:hypothetical protein